MDLEMNVNNVEGHELEDPFTSPVKFKSAAGIHEEGSGGDVDMPQIDELYRASEQKNKNQKYLPLKCYEDLLVPLDESEEKDFEEELQGLIMEKL